MMVEGDGLTRDENIGSGDDDKIQLEILQEKHLKQVVQVLEDGFGSKRCCLIFPDVESYNEMKRRYSRYPKEKWNMGVVATVVKKGDNKNNNDDKPEDSLVVVGYCQMAKKGMPVYPFNLHTCQENECYVEQIAVSNDYRGKGIGTRLLQYCENKALENNATKLSLHVLNGNPSIRLYERFGFVMREDYNAIHYCDSFLVCCLMGRPYGCRDSHWGSRYMEKDLTNDSRAPKPNQSNTIVR